MTDNKEPLRYQKDLSDLEEIITDNVDLLRSLSENDKFGLQFGMRMLKVNLAEYATLVGHNIVYPLETELYNKLRPYM
jgi:hypothetical protein